MRTETLVAQDTGSVLTFVVKDLQGVLVPDIISAVLRWRIGTRPAQESAMTVDAVNSRVSYQFKKIEGQGEDPDTYELTPGMLRAEVIVTDGQGMELTSMETVSIDVRDRL